MKKIAVISGARSDFGLIELIIEGIIKSKKLDLQLFITGMHLLKEYGDTINDFKNKNYPITKIVPFYAKISIQDKKNYTGFSISTGIKNFTKAFSESEPDLVLLSGDRVEMLAACIAAASLGISIAHIHGGDVSENAQIDEQIRHAITKFSHIHFTASKLSSQRVLQMGEEDWRVFNTGSPELDLIFQSPLFSKKELIDYLEIKEKISINDELILCIQHPSIYEAKNSGIYMGEILSCLKRLDMNTIIIYPNNDPGNELIIGEIEKNKEHKKFHIYSNLNRKLYLSLMKHAKFMIGNSSSGIIESTIFHLPVVNIGIRNLNRESSKNIITVQNGDEYIWKGIQTALSEEFREISNKAINFYGNGEASKRIVDILEQIEINDSLFRKKFILK